MSMTDLLAPYISADNQIIRFDVTEDEVRTNVEKGMDIARARVTAIKTENSPTFENTIAALETCDEEMSFVASIFFNMLSTMSTDARQALAQELGPVFSEFRNELTLDADLFKQVDSVYQMRSKLNLTPEEDTLLENTWLGFTRNGANLPEDKQKTLRELDAHMSTLSPKYSDNALKSTNDFILWCDADDVKGLPETALAQARETAKEKGGEKDYAITLHAPSYGPALTYLENRDLREKLWRAAANIATGGEHDNSQLVLDIVRCRNERAQLLGFPTHAAYVLDRRMAGSVENVTEFLNDLAKVARPKAEAELAELKKFAGLDDLKPWDLGYYSEKLRQQKFNFSAEDLRPYFPLETVLQGTFTHFEKLFGIHFVEQSDAIVWHADVKCVKVIDSKTSEFLGTLYTDFFPRESKRSGAWQSDFIGAGKFRDNMARPIVCTVYNFTKPAEGKPSLITFGEVETIFHEFGHALHNLLAKGKHQSVSGTNVFWDFVELPSQVQENWLMEDETLAMVSGHYQTGEKLPQDLINKMRAAQTFQSGLFYLAQVRQGMLDLAWHTTNPREITDVLSFEEKTTRPFTLLPYVDGCISTHFGHIFSGGYSAGYYSYLWAEVLDADAFSLFKERGLYDQDTAQSYRREILEKGGSEDPMKLFIAFRGRAPDPKAMLVRKGLIDKSAV